MMSDSIQWNSIIIKILQFLRQEAVSIVVTIALIALIGHIVSIIANRYVQHDERRHAIKKWTRYSTFIFIVIWILILYNTHVQRDTPFYLFFIGIVLATLAIALRDIFSNIVGWMIIMSGKGFNKGDRIQIGTISGDVIDVGLLRTSVAEIGDWVDADQSTGRLISMPNSIVISHEVRNYTQGFDYIWDEVAVLVTFESNWKRAETILNEIALEDFNQKREQIQERVKRVKRDFMLQYNFISPKVYISIKDSGVLLTLRYMVRCRRRRTLEDIIAREILERFGTESDIDFAYPTVRVYRNSENIRQ